jgi:DNA-binding CsgD family transcriptional regulator
VSEIVTGQDSLVDRVYEAAVVPEFWTSILADLASSIGASWSTIVSVREGQPRWVTSSEAAGVMVRAHFERFGNNLRTTRLLSKQHFGFITDYDLLTQEEIDAEPVYQEFLIPSGYGFGVGTMFTPPGGDLVVLHCENRYERGPVQPAIVRRLDRLRPHLARASMLSARLAFERARTAVETLAGIGLAACAVVQTGSVLVANYEFAADPSLWTTRGGDRIALVDRMADALLAAALRRIGAEAGVRSIPLRGGPETSPAVLHVVPVRRAAHDLFGQATAILVLTKASSVPTNRTPLLQALFDLSPTEAAVAARIAAGQSVEEIAQADAKSPETVRNQLKSVLAKTGCRRQLDLARMLAQMVPG